jgi:hypothetical protein
MRMKRRLEDWLILILMLEGVLALTLLIVFTLYRMIVPE